MNLLGVQNKLAYLNTMTINFKIFGVPCALDYTLSVQ